MAVRAKNWILCSEASAVCSLRCRQSLFRLHRQASSLAAGQVMSSAVIWCQWRTFQHQYQNLQNLSPVGAAESPQFPPFVGSVRAPLSWERELVRAFVNRKRLTGASNQRTKKSVCRWQRACVVVRERCLLRHLSRASEGVMSLTKEAFATRRLAPHLYVSCIG